MSDIGFPSLEALLAGAAAGLLAALPALALGWRLARGLPPARRAALGALAAYGLVALGAAAWGLLAQPPGAAEAAMAGMLLAGPLPLLLIAPFLFLFAPKA